MLSQILFKIISITGSVTLDGSEIQPPIDITSPSKHIEISRNSDAGIITNAGYPYRLTESIDVAEVNEVVRARVGVIHAVHRVLRFFAFPLAESPDIEMVSDTLFMYWTGGPRSSNEYDPPPDAREFEFKFETEDKIPLATYNTTKNWIRLNVADIKRDYDISYIRVTTRFVSPRNLTGSGAAIRAATPQRIAKMKNDLAIFPDDADKLFYECAYDHVNGFRLDEHDIVYKILSQKKRATDPLLQKFFDWLTQEYDLHYIHID